MKILYFIWEIIQEWLNPEPYIAPEAPKLPQEASKPTVPGNDPEFMAELAKNGPPEGLEASLPNLLDTMCQAIEFREGWISPCKEYPQGSTAFRNNNPGNLKYANQPGTTGEDAKGFAIFSAKYLGYKALQNQILLVAKNQSTKYPKDCTLLQFFGVFSPATDNNDPIDYANQVAKKMGVSINWKLSLLLS